LDYGFRTLKKVVLISANIKLGIRKISIMLRYRIVTRIIANFRNLRKIRREKIRRKPIINPMFQEISLRSY